MEVIYIVIVLVLVLDLHINLERIRLETFGVLYKHKNEIDLQVKKCEQDSLVTLHVHKMRLLNKEETLKIKDLLD